MADWIDIQANDGGSFKAYVERPANGVSSAGPHPVVLCIQEIFGVNHAMRDISKHWANQGFIAIVPDLFWRQEPGIDITDKTEAEWQKAFSLFQGFDVEKGVDDLKATVAFARQMDGASGKVGTVGFCLGGKLAYLMACRSDADCNVGYYGVGIEDLLDEASAITNPLLLHMAEEDGFVPKDAQTKVKDGLADASPVTIFSYPGMDHAFARIGGIPYDETNAALANGRTLEAFKTAL